MNKRIKKQFPLVAGVSAYVDMQFFTSVSLL